MSIVTRWVLSWVVAAGVSVVVARWVVRHEDGLMTFLAKLLDMDK